MLHNFSGVSGVQLGKESYEEQFLEGTLVLNSVYLLSRFCKQYKMKISFRYG